MENKLPTNYNDTIKYLHDNQDKEYQKFHKRLLKNDEITVIGIRTPLLRKIAKEIAKNDYKSFIEECKHQTYEENTIHGLILGYIKVSEEELEKLIDEFLPYNNNWATNDITTGNLKAFKKIKINKLDKYLKSKDPFTVRFALTIILSHYINEENIDKILKICDNVKHTDYYVMMANAWLISICYIKQKEKTLNYLKNNKLDSQTFNKAISKICDSYRVTKEEKQYLKTLRR